MEALWIILAVVVVVAIAAGIGLWAGYRSLLRRQAQVDGAWGEIVGGIERRAELVPELVETVRGYAAHEKATFEAVAQARERTLAARRPAEAAAAEGPMQQALRSLLAVAEGYPQLQASEGFLDLRRGIAEAEDRIQGARRRYNGSVRELNAKVRSFPSSLFARRAGLGAQEFFEAGDAAALPEPPRVQF